MHNSTLGYLLTWTTYGSWLPGDERGWVQRGSNGPGMPANPHSAALQREAMGRMTGQEVRLTPEQRTVVEHAIADVAKFRAWQLIELSCRSNHVHAIVSMSGATPNKAMDDFKAYATRALRQKGWFADQPVWAQGGSKRHIDSQESLRAAIQYVKFQDGGPDAGAGQREI